MMSRLFVAVCLAVAVGMNSVDGQVSETLPPTMAPEVAVSPMVTQPPMGGSGGSGTMAMGQQDALATMVSNLSKSMADVYSLLQAELRTLTQQMQTFSSVLSDVKNTMALLQATRQVAPPMPAPMPMAYLPPMSFAPQFSAPPMMPPSPPMAFPANLLSQMQMQMAQQQLPQQPPSPPQAAATPAQPAPPQQPSAPQGGSGGSGAQQGPSQQDFLMTMLAGMTGSMPPVVPPMPNAPPGLDGTAGMLQALMGAGAGGAGGGGNPAAAAAMAAAMAGAAGGAGSAAGPGMGMGPRRRDPTEMEGADMLMLMSMTGMLA